MAAGARFRFVLHAASFFAFPFHRTDMSSSFPCVDDSSAPAVCRLGCVIGTCCRKVNVETCGMYVYFIVHVTRGKANVSAGMVTSG